MGYNEYYLDKFLDEEEKSEAALPICECCGDKIYEDHGYEIDGELYCEDCAMDWMKDHKKWLY